MPEHISSFPAAQLRGAYCLDSPHLRHSLPSCACSGARTPQRGPALRRGPVWRMAMLWVACGAVAVSLVSVVR
ncbi:hypothetical protein ACWGI8_11105 [Streptomyces sp. NPDC054841]